MEFTNLQLAAILKIAMQGADIDDNSTDDEFRVIVNEMGYFGVSDEKELRSMLELNRQFSMNDALTIVSNLPDGQKREVCAFAGAIICADGQITKIEEDLWNRIREWLDYPNMTLEEAVRIFNRDDSSSSTYKRIDFKDGSYYEGEIRNGLYNGKGRIVFANGDIKEGTFVDGKMNGYGSYCWAGGDKYVGNFVNGYMQGFGEYSYSRGDRYKGCWFEDNRNGFGIYTYADGTIELGEYRADKRHGTTIMLSKSEASIKQYNNGSNTDTVRYTGLDYDI